MDNHSNNSVDYKKILEAAPDLYLILDNTFHVVAASDAYLTATAIQYKDVIGKHIFEVFPEDPNDSKATGKTNLGASLKRVVQHKTPDPMAVQKYDIQVAESNPNFEVRYWSPINIPVFNNKNKVIYIIHRVEDVTEFVKLKNLENEAHQITEALRTRNNQMEIEIFHRAQEIQKVNQELRQANVELEAFSRTVSHDLKNPLNIILNYCNLLLEQPEKNPVEYVCNIHYAANKMNKLIKDLLALSHIEHSVINYKFFNLSNLIQDIVSHLKKHISFPQAQFIIEDNIMIKGDTHLLQIAFENLVSNALKFSSKSQNPKIEFGTLPQDKSVYYLRDNGIGFSLSDIDKLFLPFSRLHSPNDFPGSGVGLSTVKRIIDRHQGEIWADSAEGKGATFYIRFKPG